MLQGTGRSVYRLLTGAQQTSVLHGNRGQINPSFFVAIPVFLGEMWLESDITVEGAPHPPMGRVYSSRTTLRCFHVSSFLGRGFPAFLGQCLELGPWKPSLEKNNSEFGQESRTLRTKRKWRELEPENVRIRTHQNGGVSFGFPLNTTNNKFSPSAKRQAHFEKDTGWLIHLLRIGKGQRKSAEPPRTDHFHKEKHTPD